MAPQHIAVLGAGSWGTALALQAVRAGVEPELDRALARADGVLIATPSHAFTDIVSAIAGLESAPPVLWAARWRPDCRPR